jgi:predicted amidophosphoribosyltransferase
MLLMTLRLTWRLVWLPVVLAIKLVHLWSVRPLLQDEIVCRVCGEHLGVLGLWQCGTCSYSFYGFYFARCEECGAVPPYLDCDACSASTLNPLIFK